LTTFVEDFIQNAPHCIANQLRNPSVPIPVMVQMP